MERRTPLLLAALLAALVLIDWLFVEHHHHPVGFLAVIGLVSCIVVVLLSKMLGKHWLQRPEDYDD